MDEVEFVGGFFDGTIIAVFDVKSWEDAIALNGVNAKGERCHTTLYFRHPKPRIVGDLKTYFYVEAALLEYMEIHERRQRRNNKRK